jgi:hypothetical protein
MPGFKKGDRVRAKAAVFDGDGRRDRNGFYGLKSGQQTRMESGVMGQCLLFMQGDPERNRNIG